MPPLRPRGGYGFTATTIETRFRMQRLGNRRSHQSYAGRCVTLRSPSYRLLYHYELFTLAWKMAHFEALDQ